MNKRSLLVGLLQNPVLMEHESFTDLLLAIYHFTEELSHGKDLRNLPGSDLKHLSGDVERAYHILVDQWLDYMSYLKSNYPYLFSLAMRTNPFDQEATPVVKHPL